MAPFKLKFRMGSSRSTSQEHDPDPQVNEALLLNHHSTAIGASSSTIDSADCNSLGSVSNSERKSLLPSKSNSLRLGCVNQNIAQCISESSTTDGDAVPTTPPPSYEHVLEENNRLSSHFKRKLYRQQSLESNRSQSRRSSENYSRNSVNLSTALEHFEFNTTCTDPDCEQNRNNYEEVQTDNEEDTYNNDQVNDEQLTPIAANAYLNISNMADGSDNRNIYSDECTDENCDGACGGRSSCDVNGGGSEDGEGSGGMENEGDSRQAGFYDPLLNHHEYYNEVAHYNEQEHSPQNYMQRDTDCWNNSDSWNSRQNQQQQQQQQLQNHRPQQQQQQEQQQQQRSSGSRSHQVHAEFEDGGNAFAAELMSNKSSKEIYKDLAKKWGITCKMSDGCRCMDCQSNYFDCEFDDNEHHKTDGGLGAGTPMFISEVMHGSACNIL